MFKKQLYFREKTVFAKKNHRLLGYGIEKGKKCSRREKIREKNAEFDLAIVKDSTNTSIIDDNYKLVVNSAPEVYYTFNESHILTMQVPQYLSNQGELFVNWDAEDFAEEYEFEWLHISNKGAKGVTIPYLQLSYDFRFNSTRVKLKESFYSIPLLYSEGYIIYRVRAIGRTGSNFEHDIYGTWSIPQTGNIVSAGVDHRYWI